MPAAGDDGCGKFTDPSANSFWRDRFNTLVEACLRTPDPNRRYATVLIIAPRPPISHAMLMIKARLGAYNNDMFCRSSRCNNIMGAPCLATYCRTTGQNPLLHETVSSVSSSMTVSERETLSLWLTGSAAFGRRTSSDLNSTDSAVSPSSP